MARTARVVGKNLRALREAAGLSVEEVAERVHLGESQIRKMETGARCGSIPTLEALARVFRVSVVDLLTAPPRRAA